jgi:hypothetical protein
MTPEAAFNEKFRICNHYFTIAKARSIKFCQRHLAQLERQLDAKIPLDSGLGNLFKYVYTRSIRINKENNELEVHNIIEDIINDGHSLFNLIPKEDFENPYNQPVLLSIEHGITYK